MLPQNLIGTYRLLKHGFQKSNGEYVPTSANPRGQLIYAADGSMSVLIIKPDEAKVVEDIIVYSGRWSISEKGIFHHVDFSPRASREGGSEIRLYELNGDQLTLKSEPTSEGQYVIVWERI